MKHKQQMKSDEVSQGVPSFYDPKRVGFGGKRDWRAMPAARAGETAHEFGVVYNHLGIIT